MSGARHEILSATDFGRVAVMLGGRSSERDVSLDSGNAVLNALISRGVDAVPWDPATGSFSEFLNAGFDRVCNILHGPGGEDGALQGALDWCGIPYTGSGVLASAIAMDKVRTKALFRSAGLATPRWVVLDGDHDQAEDLAGAAEAVCYPLFVKPVSQGSSVGMSKVNSASELHAACAAARAVESRIMLEEFIDGREYTVALLNGEALPSIRIETPHVFYDYDAKYMVDTTRYICPGLDGADEQRCRELAVAAFSVLGCRGWGRADFMAGANGELQLIEVNTVPGMTSHSLVPMAAEKIGLDFEDLCWRILETSFVTARIQQSGDSAHGA